MLPATAVPRGPILSPPGVPFGPGVPAGRRERPPSQVIGKIALEPRANVFPKVLFAFGKLEVHRTPTPREARVAGTSRAQCGSGSTTPRNRGSTRRVQMRGAEEWADRGVLLYAAGSAPTRQRSRWALIVGPPPTGGRITT